MERFITINKAPTESPDPEEPKPGPSHEKLLDSDVEEHPVQKKNKKHYNESRKFNQNWTAKFVWLEKSNNSEKPFCKVCKKTINVGITHIKRHEATTIHQRNFQKMKNTPKIQTFVDKNKETNSLIKSGEFKLIMFLHEHNLPFSLMDHLPGLLQSVCPDSKIAKQIKCARTKATVLTKNALPNSN
ncbi:unnamed protein product [Callosobruchus maculatus]|uniref:Uncharacterized protein n=1 Tax=Callosobruchus maculatus TaxID=64391 RepID=A0A653BW24_CALMS|nr:unnamed protein product [Callosobruchus maculatus]